MQFIKESSDDGAKVLAQRLVKELREDKRVLWLLSGGSNIALEARIMRQLLGYEAKLTVILSDERFGPVGHADSNWRQLFAAGFEPGEAVTIPILFDDLTLEATAAKLDANLRSSLVASDAVLGQFGMGDDGHIAGILPEAAGAAIDTGSWAMGYNSATYQRVSITFAVFKQLTAAYCFVYGASKLSALKELKSKNLDLTIQPAQILKQIPESYVYNDQLGEEEI